MNKAKVIIAICILIAGLFGYVIGKNSTRIVPTTNTQLNLSYEQVKASGVDSAQQKQIEDFVATFYDYLYEKDITKLLALFTPATTKEEQNDLDFLLGKDYAVGTDKPLPRLFSTQGYNYNVGGYYIRDITHHNDTTAVLIDEMRVIYSGGEYVGWSANIANLTLKINQNKSELKIVKYYHQQPNTKANKYNGFEAY